MKSNKYDALEFCRRAIKSCKTQEQSNGAFNLIFNFRRMFPDDLSLFNLLDSELFYRREELRNEIQNNGQIDPEIQKLINDNFWDMLGEDTGDRLISLNKACEWLENNLPPAMVRSDCYMFNGEFIEDFKKAMKESEE